MDRRKFLQTALGAIVVFLVGGKIKDAAAAKPAEPGLREAMYYRSPDTLAG